MFMASNDAQILSGKTALITGGSRGIGRAIAEAYARQGARVFICGRDENKLRAAIDEIRRSGGEIDGLAGDVGNQEDVERIAGAAVERYGADPYPGEQCEHPRAARDDRELSASGLGRGFTRLI